MESFFGIFVKYKQIELNLIRNNSSELTKIRHDFAANAQSRCASDCEARRCAVFRIVRCVQTEHCRFLLFVKIR